MHPPPFLSAMPWPFEPQEECIINKWFQIWIFLGWTKSYCLAIYITFGYLCSPDWWKLFAQGYLESQTTVIYLKAWCDLHFLTSFCVSLVSYQLISLVSYQVTQTLGLWCPSLSFWKLIGSALWIKTRSSRKWSVSKLELTGKDKYALKLFSFYIPIHYFDDNLFSFQKEKMPVQCSKFLGVKILRWSKMLVKISHEKICLQKICP